MQVSLLFTRNSTFATATLSLAITPIVNCDRLLTKLFSAGEVIVTCGGCISLVGREEEIGVGVGCDIVEGVGIGEFNGLINIVTDGVGSERLSGLASTSVINTLVSVIFICDVILVSTVTAVKGNFTISNVPVGPEIPGSTPRATSIIPVWLALFLSVTLIIF